MKKLTTRHFFAGCRAMTNIGIRQEIVDVTTKVEEAKKRGEAVNMNDIGLDMVLAIFEKAVSQKGENEIYQFLATILDKEPKDIESADLIDLMDELLEAVDMERWKIFFKQVASLMKKR